MVVSFPCLCVCRADLDLDSEALDKLPDLFSFSVDIKVSNDERPCRDQLSWNGWTPSNAKKLTPFSGQEELDDTLQLYGKNEPFIKIYMIRQ